jgi:phage I-like protein
MKQGDHDSKKRIAFPIQLFGEGSAFAELPDEIHVVPTGKWKHPYFGEFEFTSQDIAEFVQNFKDGVRLDLRITAGHDNGMSGGELPAIGWFKELIDRGVKGLYAVVEWNEEGTRLLTARAYKYFSAELYVDYEDPQNGEIKHHVLTGGALTNSPYFKELDPVIAFSEPGIMNQFNEPMDLKTILAKKAEELSAEEKAFVRDHKGELDADQLSAFKSVIDEPAIDPAADPAPAVDPAPAADPAPAPAPVEASELKGKQVLMSEAEVTILRQQADKGAQAFAEVEKMKLGTEVDKLVFSSSNTEKGRILPKHKEAVVELLFSLPQKQRDQLRNVLSNLPKPDKSIFDELGHGGGTDESSAGLYKKITDMAKAKVTASEGKTKFSQALLEVYSENPGLKKQYEEVLASENK